MQQQQQQKVTLGPSMTASKYFLHVKS